VGLGKGRCDALTDETRLKLFKAISSRPEMHCGEIVSMGGVTPATVSHHLKILSEADLIECRREGQFVCNRAISRNLGGIHSCWS
jgi:DNA-binding transcriptional ArsR family regulator